MMCECVREGEYVYYLRWYVMWGGGSVGAMQEALVGLELAQGME